MIIAKLLALHFIADFILQSREMGKKKSSEWRWLLAHLSIQFAIFLVVGWKFALANAAIHGLIDWNIWKLYKLYAFHKIKKEVKRDHVGASDKDLRAFIEFRSLDFKYWEDHMFYTTIGFDQLLHGITLVYLAGVFL